MDQLEESLANLNQVIEQNPENAWTFAHRGETYRSLEHYREALADFSRAIELKPDYAWAIAHRGETYYLMEQYEKALVDFNRAIELSPDYAWALAHRGLTHKMAERNEAALADFNRAVELKPDYAWAIAQRGNTHMALSCYEGALADLDRVITLDEILISPWQGERGLILNALGRYAETIVCCEKALKENPQDYIAMYSLVVAKVRRQGVAHVRPDIDKTRMLLHTALHSTARAQALYRLGGLAALENRRDEALTYLQEAISIEREPRNMACHDPAWLDLRLDSHFQALITAAISL